MVIYPAEGTYHHGEEALSMVSDQFLSTLDGQNIPL